MVRVITQETFDAVVKENVDELGMSREEAVQDAKEQFSLQGVNLSNIVLSGDDLVQAIDKLKESNCEEKRGPCDIIARECSKGLAERILATNSGAYFALVQCARTAQDEDTKKAAILALANLLDGYPDSLDAEGFVVIVDGLDVKGNDELVAAALALTLNCCIKHEDNRQNLVRNKILPRLESCFDRHPLKVAQIWQALVQDDDIRAQFGQAHEHARMIVEDHAALKKLANVIKGSVASNHKDLVIYFSCLSNITVRNEYCQHVVDEGLLQAIIDLLTLPSIEVDVLRESLRLIKTLAGSDDVKKEIAKANGMALVLNAVNKNISSRIICQMGCAAITAACLRCPDNAKQTMASDGASLLVQILKTHLDAPKVLISCANAIRNVVSRCREFCPEFVSLDVESALCEARARHKQADDPVRAALRDLGLKVELREQWKGGAFDPPQQEQETNTNEYE